MVISKKTIIEGVQHFPGREVQMLISIETNITCDFPGGPDPQIPPLDPHMHGHYLYIVFHQSTNGFN